MNWLLAHPQLILWAFPFILATCVAFIGRIEKAGISYLLSRGDTIDQDAMRATCAIWVKWAERRAAPNADGSSKFATVDKFLSHALPFLSTDERKNLIESSVAAMDAAAQDALKQNQVQKP